MELENKFIMSDEMEKEYIKKVLCKRYNKQIILIVLFCIAFMAYAYFNNDRLIMAIFGTCGIIALLAGTILPSTMKRELDKTNRALHDGKKPLTRVVFDNEITMYEGEVKIRFKYSQVMKIYRLNTVYALMIGKSNAIVVDPNGFTKGSLTDFEKLLKKKCPELS